MEYTWYIPTIYLVGVPDAGPSIWNPDHLDTGKLVTVHTCLNMVTVETCMYMFTSLHTVMNMYVHNIYMYMNIHHDICKSYMYMTQNFYRCMYMVHTCL